MSGRALGPETFAAFLADALAGPEALEYPEPVRRAIVAVRDAGEAGEEELVAVVTVLYRIGFALENALTESEVAELGLDELEPPDGFDPRLN